jgi:hypothetical protein
MTGTFIGDRLRRKESRAWIFTLPNELTISGSTSGDFEPELAARENRGSHRGERGGGLMADAVTALVGAVLMIAFLGLIVVKLMEVALGVVCLVGISAMLWGFWVDTVAPLVRRRSG